MIVFTTICSFHILIRFSMNICASLCLLGGDDGIRTHDPLLAGQVLSQLSYTPILKWFVVIISASLSESFFAYLSFQRK